MTVHVAISLLFNFIRYNLEKDPQCENAIIESVVRVGLQLLRR